MFVDLCEKGLHYYDKDLFDSCPFCAEEQGDANVTVGGNDNATEPAWAAPKKKERVSAMTGNIETSYNEDDKTTVNYWQLSNKDGDKAEGNACEQEPVVGWLVCISGIVKGKSFELHAGKNYMGRSNGVKAQNIVIPDPSVSREHHGVVIYDPKSGEFLVNGGDAQGLLYLNDGLVTGTKTLTPYDRLALGDSELLFVPFCCEKFSWF